MSETRLKLLIVDAAGAEAVDAAIALLGDAAVAGRKVVVLGRPKAIEPEIVGPRPDTRRRKHRLDNQAPRGPRKGQ